MGSETEERILRELKQRKSELKRCCREARSINTDETMDHDQYRKGYMGALLKEVEANPPQVSTDILKNVKEYNLLLRKTIQDKEQLNLHEKAVLNDAEATVKRLEDRIKMVKEALIESEKQDNRHGKQITEMHVQSVRQKFLELRNAMNVTINAHFGIHATDVRTILQELMKAKSDDGYVSVNNGNFKIIQFLKEYNVVATNPYNSMEVKMAF